MPEPVTLTLPQLVDRARTLTIPGERRLLGLTGSPGAGKSTLAAALQAALGDGAALLPMDGFHLANEELRRLGRVGRKGAPDTFDVGGYAALLARVRAQEEDVVYAPRFDRHLEESIGSALPIPRAAPLVITEGNYLLLDGPWQAACEHMDEVWFLAPPDDLRRAGLVARHEAHGRGAQAARDWVKDVDDANARLIEATRDRADLIVTLNWT
ncbi:nucleoside/nucleotide kinase family protein [Deinococcus daejeonensis]|uniref:Nucleoside/nucleotide kinase family protein n=1 Tax=Deinococcus daejeonensis TaxID=1007098 RepID=A0ABQ2JG06_9DEIO|nr:nucleoside/nucleotide kinase family protein [Deinococcus daejeonensis]GGN44363.1 nucleoside/nucleotide kinase family protein [Deinococcus daejeonensis]